MNPKLKLIKSLLLKIIEDIDAGNTNDDEETLNTALDTLNKLNNATPRYSKAYLCDNILHCSQSAFNNYLSIGLIPPGTKVKGFKELSWSIKDMDKVIKYRREKRL